MPHSSSSLSAGSLSKNCPLAVWQQLLIIIQNIHTKKKNKELNGFQFKFCQRLAALVRVKNETLPAVEGINFVVWDLRFSCC